MSLSSKLFAFAVVATAGSGFGARFWLDRSHAPAAPTAPAIAHRTAGPSTSTERDRDPDRSARSEPTDLREAIQNLIDRDYDNFQDTRAREIVGSTGFEHPEWAMAVTETIGDQAQRDKASSSVINSMKWSQANNKKWLEANGFSIE